MSREFYASQSSTSLDYSESSDQGTVPRELFNGFIADASTAIQMESHVAPHIMWASDALQQSQISGIDFISYWQPSWSSFYTYGHEQDISPLAAYTGSPPISNHDSDRDDDSIERWDSSIDLSLTHQHSSDNREGSSLVRHCRVFRDEETGPLRSTQRRERYDCACGKVFTKQAALSRHIRKDKNQGKHRCGLAGCTSVFHRADSRVRHLRNKHGLVVKTRRRAVQKERGPAKETSNARNTCRLAKLQPLRKVSQKQSLLSIDSAGTVLTILPSGLSRAEPKSHSASSIMCCPICISTPSPAGRLRSESGDSFQKIAVINVEACHGQAGSGSDFPVRCWNDLS